MDLSSEALTKKFPFMTAKRRIWFECPPFELSNVYNRDSVVKFQTLSEKSSAPLASSPLFSTARTLTVPLWPVKVNLGLNPCVLNKIGFLKKENCILLSSS